MATVRIEKVWIVSCEACIEYTMHCNTKEDAVLVAREHRNSQGHKEWVEHDKAAARASDTRQWAPWDNPEDYYNARAERMP